ncbi:quinol:cytochrome C oxidoreductase [Flavobacterium salilacus subsp. salilacus]|uniref:quinol:cytochrome C oxidoreductase n=1 Tax=Flavobacterium TaxID=237 RepID=UPI0010754052|nr:MULTISPECIES: quinol:cytochrome C oxidoreductase [Flavobacterium]KAF2520013.1 quinol:cytochrome C oxidoreductase [Flavobacterium salilacus subsp. salilacus]MBE1614071.1 quinol:cytochrome C oxidoreductase [Flavobacterium sp. SaA2.13]
MYTFSSRLKTFSFVLIALGILGIGYSFLTAPKTVEDVEKILAAENAHGGHGAAHHDAGNAHGEDAHGHHAVSHDEAAASHANHGNDAHAEADHHAGADDAHAAHDEHQEHLEHVLHQLQNKPWSALYIAALFFMLISLGALTFYAIQNAAQAGWSPVLFRVMESISSYLVPGAIIVFILLVLGVLDMHHIFIWMDEDVVAHDHLIQAKSGYLNGPFFLIRAAIFMGGWIWYRQYSRKNSLLQDDANDNTHYKKNFKASATFLVFFIISESIMSWDWIMSVDPHWYSTLFGWYVFASFFVSGITAIALITVYLKGKGYLEYVNTSHIHDLAKFMFGISIFWTYLWFSQFMLMWYADIPEEVVYFKTRIEDYNLPFFGMLAMNFLFPVLILINTDFKRLSWIIVMAGIVILCGHYIDFFNMIMPATVGDRWFIGAGEIGSVLLFLGLFIFVVFTTLTKAPLLAKRNPLIEESKHFHY